MSQPSLAKQPGPRRHDGRTTLVGWLERVPRPAVEPSGGARRIRSRRHPLRRRTPDALCQVLPRVEQHVGDRVSHLPRSPESAQVVAVGKDASGEGQGAARCERKPRRERHHAAGERASPVGFDDEVRVIRLDGIVHDAEVVAPQTLERVFEGAHEAHGAECWHAGTHAQCDVCRLVRSDAPARKVRHTRPRTRLSARSDARTAPARRGAQGERELLRRLTPHGVECSDPLRCRNGGRVFTVCRRFAN